MISHNPASATERAGAESSPGRPSQLWFDRVAWPVFAAAAGVAAILILWLGRDMTLSVDEMDLFMETPDLDLEGALEPHVGHLMLTTRLVYKAIFSTLGVGYLPFQLLTLGIVILTAGLFFAYAGRRIGKLAALAPTLVLLVFGSDSLHILAGNGFTVIGALACGLGALLALDRDDRTGDVIAAALLCLGVVTYSVAIPFVVGVAVAIMLRDDRWRRAWVFLVPVALYGAWWLWSLGLDSSSESQIALGDALLFPSWVFQSMSGILGALAGLDYSFNGENQAGPTLAVLALVGVGWRFSRGRVPKMVWASLAIALALWFMETISTGEIRTPDTPRYLYSGALVVLIAGSWVAAGVGWRRPALVALFLLAASGVATNVAELRGTGGFNRAEALQQQAVLGGFEVAGANADPSYVPELGPGPIRYWAGHDVGDYLEAAARYESIGYSPAQLRGLAEPLRELADQGLVGALGLKLTPAAEKASGRRCVDLGTDPGGTSSFELASGQALDLESDQQATVAVGRFADSPNVSVGILQPGQAMTLAVPADTTPDPWVVSSSAPTRACIAR